MDLPHPRDEAEIENLLEKSVAREFRVHGAEWARQNQGYFSDPAIAGPFLEMVEAAAQHHQPDVIVDLGGGTGFILQNLIRRGRLAPTVRLVNLDLSAAQLAQIHEPRIRALKGSFLELARSAVAGEAERLMLITRSTLHYAGLAGQRPVLAHIRAQLRPGECFIQQTACESDPEAALRVDEMLERMHSDKWLPPLKVLLSLMEQTGFRINRMADAPPIVMSERMLGERYQIAPEEMARIREALQARYADLPGLQLGPDGFLLRMPYKIMECVAV